MPELKINGECRSFPVEDFPATVAQLLQQLGFDPARVVAEVDGVLVGRADFQTHAITPGQSVELVRFVGGG